MTTNLAESDESLQAFVADPQWVHFVGALMREQLGAVFEELEHAHYPPGTPKNDLFHLRLMNWEEMQWAMASIPAQDKHLMEAACAKHGMRVADGVPTMVSGDEVKRFPADNARVFHLEARGMPAKARDEGVDHAAEFIRGMPFDGLRNGKEREIAHKLVDILKPFEPEKRNKLIKQAMDQAYQTGKADGSVAATAEWARIQKLPLRERATALSAATANADRGIARLELQEAKLKTEKQLVSEILAWIQAPLVLESPRGSAWHKVKEADKAEKLYKLKTNGTGLGTVKFDGAEPGIQVFVVEHDWARAFANATDFEGGAVKMPFDICVFEFRISGRRVCLLAGQAHKPDFLGSGVIFVSGSNDAWCCLGPPQSDGALSALLSQQVRAVCIALDAEVAVSEVERAPAKLNESRAKKGKLPLKDYHVVSLARRSRAAPLPRSGDEPQWHKRLHFVRGHWRHYQRAENDFKTWIKWHLRGNPDLGFIDKHYKL